MAHPDLIIDTSIIIDHLRKRNKRKSILFHIVDQLIEIRDLLIASTALVHGLPLMTLNTKHFQRIDDLSLADPPSILL